MGEKDRQDWLNNKYNDYINNRSKKNKKYNKRNKNIIKKIILNHQEDQDQEVLIKNKRKEIIKIRIGKDHLNKENKKRKKKSIEIEDKDE